MFTNYFKLAWRTILKHRFYAALNILGLFAGILFMFLVGAYVFSELQVNKDLRNSGNQYFLQSKWTDPAMGSGLTTFGPLSKRLKEDYPNLVANYYRWDGITSVVSRNEKYFRENIQICDSSFLNMYGFGLLYGNPQNAMSAPFSVVITQDIAKKYFGEINVVGKTIAIQSFSGGIHDFMITGVLKNLPENSVTMLNAENHNTIFIPSANTAFFGRLDFNSWSNINLPSYIELKKGISPGDIAAPIQKLIQENAPAEISRNLSVQAISLKDYYLQKNQALVLRMMYILSFAGLFIVLMAIINFINLSISSSGNRIKEIGIRKVLGSLRNQLIIQFLTESFILVFIATSLALLTYPFAKNIFEMFVGKTIPSLNAFPWYFIFLPVLLIVIVGLLSGLYPALVLSTIKAADAVKGKLKSPKENVLLRKSLVGFQFSVALIVLISAIIVSQQLMFFFGQNLGYDKEYIVSSQVPRDWTEQGVQKMLTIRNEFANIPQVSNVTLSYEIPNGNNGGQPPVYRNGLDSTKAVSMQALVTDENYLATYKIPLEAGSFFDNSGPDALNVILNEKATKALGFASAGQAVGQQIRMPGDPSLYTIKGVTNDFHFSSMQQAIQCNIFFDIKSSFAYRYLSFKLKPGNIQAGIEAIQKKWSILLPGSSFEYTFMDDTLKKLYASEMQLQQAAYTATFLLMIIVLLGVLGLITLSIQKRLKEIGIRKVLGASVKNILQVFTKEFTGIIILSALVACPVAYFIMNAWLNNYAYHIKITAFPFLLSFSILSLFTVLLICIKTWKAARTNPVKSLRSE